jgi:hypothetical protein
MFMLCDATFCSSTDQISLKTPNHKCRLFLKMTSKGTWWQVFICLMPPVPPPPRYTLYEYITLCLFTQGRGQGACEPVRRLEGRKYTRRVENTNMTVSPVYKLYKTQVKTTFRVWWSNKNLGGEGACRQVPLR